MLVKTFRNGIEIIKDFDENGERRYTAVNPKGYIGRTRIGEHWEYRTVLRLIREYLENNPGRDK